MNKGTQQKGLEKYLSLDDANSTTNRTFAVKNTDLESSRLALSESALGSLVARISRRTAQLNYDC